MKQSPLRLKSDPPGYQLRIRQQQDDDVPAQFHRHACRDADLFPPVLPSFDPLFVRDTPMIRQKARKLLVGSGFPDGSGLPVIKLLTVPIYADLGSFIARQLEEVGIKVQVEVVQKALLLEQTAKSEALFFRGSWIADYPEAENYLSVFYGKNPAPPNYTQYKNPAFDRLYEKSIAHGK